MADALLEYRKQLEPLREALREADSLGRAAPLEDAERLRRRLQRGSSTLDRLIEDGQAGKVPWRSPTSKRPRSCGARSNLTGPSSATASTGAEASDEGSVAEPAAAVAAPAAAAPEVLLVDTAALDAAAPTGAGGPPEVPSIDVAAPTGAGGPPEVPSVDVAAPAGVADAVAFCERLVRRRKRLKASECEEALSQLTELDLTDLDPKEDPALSALRLVPNFRGRLTRARKATLQAAAPQASAEPTLGLTLEALRKKHAALLKRRQRAKDPSQLAQVLQELQEVEGLLVGKKIAERLPVMEAAKSTTAAAADRVEKARRRRPPGSSPPRWPCRETPLRPCCASITFHLGLKNLGQMLKDSRLQPCWTSDHMRLTGFVKKIF